MKRILSLLIVLLLCFSVFTGCTQNDGDKAQFDFSYSVEKTKYARGETIKITATVTNVSGKTYKYDGCSSYDFIPSISLYNSTDKQYELSHEGVLWAADVKPKKVKNGGSGTWTYEFVIPEDSKLGKYSITLSREGDRKEFTDILSIVELTAQNENEKYSYSSAIVGTADKGINPIQTLAHTTQYTSDGEPWLFGDGMGYYGIFSDAETIVGDFPTIVAEGELEATVQGSNTLGNPRVFGMDYEEYKYSHPGWNGLHLLPAGEYLVVFYENTDTRKTNPNSDTYWVTVYENIFRLVVPEREMGEDYYSLTFNQTYSLDREYDLNTKYRAGERVEIRLQLVYEQYYEVTVGDEKAVMIGNEDTYVIYVFIMPEGDAHVQIKEVSVEIPSAP